MPREKGSRINPRPERVKQAIDSLEHCDGFLRGIAAEIGVSDRTLRRWRDNIDWPAKEHHSRLLAIIPRL